MDITGSQCTLHIVMLIRFARSVQALICKPMICDAYDRLRIKTIETDRKIAVIVRVDIGIESLCAMCGTMAVQPSSPCGSLWLLTVSLNVIECRDGGPSIRCTSMVTWQRARFLKVPYWMNIEYKHEDGVQPLKQNSQIIGRRIDHVTTVSTVCPVPNKLE